MSSFPSRHPLTGPDQEGHRSAGIEREHLFGRIDVDHFALFAVSLSMLLAMSATIPSSSIAGSSSRILSSKTLLVVLVYFS